MAAKEKPDLPDLYFIGPDRGDGKILRKIMVDCPKIHWQEYVSREELAENYCTASLFILPSLAEGFGLPLVESMRAGTPVLCSDIPVFHELGGHAVWYVSPNREAFCRALLNLDLRQMPGAEILRKQAEPFQWRKTAEAQLEIYRELLKSTDVFRKTDNRT